MSACACRASVYTVCGLYIVAVWRSRLAVVVGVDGKGLILVIRKKRRRKQKKEVSSWRCEKLESKCTKIKQSDDS